MLITVAKMVVHGYFFFVIICFISVKTKYKKKIYQAHVLILFSFTFQKLSNFIDLLALCPSYKIKIKKKNQKKKIQNTNKIIQRT